MLFSVEEIEALRLCAWCKDLPVACGKYLAEEAVALLRSIGYLRQSRCGQSYRVTLQGYAFLDSIGLHYEPDRQYRGQGAVLTRRLQMAELVLFFYRMGANVFLDALEAGSKIPSFLPSFALRRKAASNLLGGSRFAGICYGADIALIPYYLSDGNDGLYPMAEERIFTADRLLMGRKPFVVYTGKPSLDGVITVSPNSRDRKTKSTTQTFAQASRMFSCGVGYVPLTQWGLRQLRILLEPDYRTRLAKKLLGSAYMPAADRPCDAVHRTTKEPYLVGIGCDFNQFESVVNEGVTAHIILLANQLTAVGKYLQGRNVILHPLELEVVEGLLQIPSSLPSPNQSPFLTQKGGYVHVPAFFQARKAGKQMQ